MDDALKPATRKLFGIIGYPLKHSFSPKYFQQKFLREGIDARYEAFPLSSIAEFPKLLKQHPDLCGLNVTAPYKESVLPFLDEIDADAKAIGAVNCIHIAEGKLIGYNTDWLGFSESLKPLLQTRHCAALILGNGGASKAVRFALRQMNIAFKTVSATPGKADFLYSELDAAMLKAFPIIINTTILGTQGVGIPDLPYDGLTSGNLLYELVYNPPLTGFLAEGKARGAKVKNGEEMLVLQAEAGWELWNQNSPLRH